MERKPERQASPGLPRQDKTHTPHGPTDDPSQKEPLRQALGKTKKRELREVARRLHEKDWLAPAGSEQEKQILRRWAKREDLSREERDQIYKSISNSDELAKRNMLFWHAAKKSVLGDVVHKTAMERHTRLNNKEWLVAFFTAQGITQREIAELTHMVETTVDNTIRSLKGKICQELDFDNDKVDRVLIARWFLGL